LTESNDSTKRGSVKSTLAKKVLMPIAATAASAAASYLAKKGPQFLEQKVLPWLRDSATGVGNAAHDLPDRAKSAADGINQASHDLTERAKSAVTSGSDGGDEAGGGRTATRQSVSSAERQRQRSERAQHRAARRKATTS
jgi:hypothetical protein